MQFLKVTLVTINWYKPLVFNFLISCLLFAFVLELTYESEYLDLFDLIIISFKLIFFFD